MRGCLAVRRMLALGSCVALTATGCAFGGINSLPLPGAVGRGANADIYHVEVGNVLTMESNSPVLIDDVVVGSVGPMKVKDWHADIQISVKRDVVVPANVVATLGQTSLLGSMHLELNPPLGRPGVGRLRPGATIPLNRSSTYPSTEQTLSSLSLVVNGGGLGQIGDIIHNFSAALSGRAGDVRDLLVRLDRFVGTLDQQRDNLVSSIQALSRLAEAFAGQRDVLTEVLRKIPPALDVLIKERPRLTSALDHLREFSNTATGLVNSTQADLVKNLKNLEPTLRALADVGPELDSALSAAPTFPFPQNFIDRAIRGDFFNEDAQLDLTIPRLKRGLLLGTHFGQMDEQEVPAPGDPYYLNYTLDPMGAGPGTRPGPLAPPAVGPPLPGPAAPNVQFSGPLPGPAPAPPGAPLPGPAAAPPAPEPLAPSSAPPAATDPTQRGG